MSNPYPLVSVAVVTYNQFSYLKECLESIVSQEYPNFEIIVADDCSTDGTGELLRYFQQKYPNLFTIIYSEKNEGVTSNQNKALFKCKGNYISWIGGDDLMKPNKITKQVEFLESNPDCNICYHQMEILDDNFHETKSYFNNSSNSINGGVESLIKFGTFNCASSCMVRVSSMPKSGFDKSIPIASDWLYWIECLVNGGSINFLNESLGIYRRHQNNLTNELSSSYLNNVIDHLNTCTIIITRYPKYSKIAYRRFNKLIWDNRKLLRLDYSTLKYLYNYKATIAFLVYKLSNKKIQL
jgi:glycosyltransferase involved in cell wall biosynthesis